MNTNLMNNAGTDEVPTITPEQESLTKGQELLCDQVADDYILQSMTYQTPDLAVIRAWLHVVYGLEPYRLAVPDRIEIVSSPEAAYRLASELTGTVQSSLDWIGLGDDGWIAAYYFYERVKVLSDAEMAEVHLLRDYIRVAWDSILLDECAIIVARPTAIHVDENGEPHCASGPCIEWGDGEGYFAWHGQWVPERIIRDPKSYSKDEYLAITNTEERRVLGEIAGWDWIGRLLGGTVIDTWKDPTTGLTYGLWRCADGGPTLLRKQSPTLKDTSQPWYTEPVHEDLRTAAAARKWQATRLSVAECERDPSLSYEVES